LGFIPAEAHDFPLDRVMNAFIKIDAHQADLVIRIPLDLLNGVPFPVSGNNYYNVAASSLAAKTALDQLAIAIELWEGNTQLHPSKSTGKLVPLSDHSFQDFGRAIAQVDRPASADVAIGYDLGYFDAHFVYPISSPNSAFSIDNHVGSDLEDYASTAIRFMPFAKSSRVMMITGTSGRVTLDPPWYEASLGFIKLGIGHILSGIDHLLFLLCLVIPFRRIRSLVPVITAFTVGHSVTLIGTAYGLAPPGRWFPPFVEMMIAVSIVYMALENIVGASLRRRPVRARARVWLCRRSERAAPVRRLKSADRAVLIQCRDRDRSTARFMRFRAGSGSAVSRRHGGTNGHHRAVGPRCAYGVALDDRSRRSAVANSVA
jgi:hypothetical protein